MINLSINASSQLLRVHQQNSSLMSSEYIAQVCYLPNLTVERMLVLILGFWLIAASISMLFVLWRVREDWRSYIETFSQNIAHFCVPVASFVALTVIFWQDATNFSLRNKVLILLMLLFLSLLILVLLDKLFCFLKNRRKPEVMPSEKSELIQDY